MYIIFYYTTDGGWPNGEKKKTRTTSNFSIHVANCLNTRPSERKRGFMRCTIPSSGHDDIPITRPSERNTVLIISTP